MKSLEFYRWCLVLRIKLKGPRAKRFRSWGFRPSTIVTVIVIVIVISIIHT